MQMSVGEGVHVDAVRQEHAHHLWYTIHNTMQIFILSAYIIIYIIKIFISDAFSALIKGKREKKL